MLLYIIDRTFLGGDTVKFGAQRLWGAVGWGVISVITGSIIDWYSAELEHKNYLPGYLISTTMFLVDFVVAWKLKVGHYPTHEIYWLQERVI